jgi:hypothetical protein
LLPGDGTRSISTVAFGDDAGIADVNLAGATEQTQFRISQIDIVELRAGGLTIGAIENYEGCCSGLLQLVLSIGPCDLPRAGFSFMRPPPLN